MTFWLVFLGVIVALYCGLCLFVVYGTGPFGFMYVPVIAWFLRKIGMSAITIGATCFVADRAYLHLAGPQHRLYRHEIVHYGQWRARPLTFALRYLWLLATKGYAHHDDEDEARKAE